MKNIGMCYIFSPTREEINNAANSFKKIKKEHPDAENIEVVIEIGKIKIETTFESIFT